MSGKLTIRLLSGFSLELDGKPVTGLPSRKAEALLAYLVMHHRPFPRELLADFLWDDRPQDQTLANLRSLLSGMRRKLGDFLIVTRQTVRFNHEANYWLDVDDFTAKLPAPDQNEVPSPKDVSQLETAVSAYQGHFLEGFYVRESRRFEEWVSIERERLQRLAVNGLHQLVQTLLNLGRYAAGIEYAVRLLEFDPLSEAAHRCMMLLLARHGQRNNALQQYDVCCQILESELGVSPANATTSLYERIRSSQTAPLHNLPPQTTAFVGRETELAELLRLLANENGRFITLLGPGGIGKTRLALQAAKQITQNQPGMFLHGIRFVPLHTIDSGEFLSVSIAEAFDFSFSRPQPPEEQLINYLRGKEVLLILDNFEQILQSANSGRHFLTRILQEAPFVKLLLTSRSRLHAPGEQLFDMRGLAFPTGSTAVLAESYSAVRLFVESARRVRQDFRPDRDEMAAIVRICRLLDGVPLGIELAAAWVRVLSCNEIETGIGQDLDFLQQSGHASTDRHASLRAAFAYSWRLLPPDAQQSLMQLAVFRGQFDREAAAQVAGVQLPLLARLVDQSWIRHAAQESGRYEMLTVMRQYVRGQLAQLPSLKTAVYQRYLDYFATFLRAKLPALQGGEQRDALNAIAAQIEDVRSAVDWAVVTQDAQFIEQVLDSLFHFYDTRSWFQEGASVFGRCETAVSDLPVTPTHQRTLSRLQARRGWFLFHLGEYETSQALLRQSLATLRAQNNAADMVFCLNYLGAVTRHLGEHETAAAHLQEALHIAQDIDDALGASIALNILGQVASLQGDFDTARERCRRGLAIKRRIGDHWGMTYSLTYLGRVAQAVGDLDEAQTLFEESMRICESLGDRRGVAFALQNLAQTALAQGVPEEAARYYQESLDMSREIGDRLGVAFTQIQLGELNGTQSNMPAARRLLIAGLQEAVAIGSTPAMLEGVLATAVLHVQEGERETAVAHLSYVTTHSGTNQGQRAKANELLKQLHPKAAADQSALPIESYVQHILQREQVLVSV